MSLRDELAEAIHRPRIRLHLPLLHGRGGQRRIRRPVALRDDPRHRRGRIMTAPKLHGGRVMGRHPSAAALRAAANGDWASHATCLADARQHPNAQP